MRELMAHSVEVWESDPKAYSYHPVGYMQISPELHARAGRHDLRAAEGDRLRIRVHRGRRRLPEIYDRSVRRLAGQGHHLGPAREAGRLRQQHRLDVWIGQQGRGGRRAHPDRRRGEGLRVRLELGRRDGAHNQSRQYRLRPCRRRRRPLGLALLEHARSAEGHLDQGPRRQGPRRRAYVDLLVPRGGHSRRRPGDAQDQ